MTSLSRDDVREVDRCAIEELGIPGMILMENAGRNAADAAALFLDGDPDGKRVAIVAGPGNNGGDGFVVARHLGNRGAAVETFLVGPEEKLSGDAMTNYDALIALGQTIHLTADDGAIESLGNVLSGFDLVVDAVGGTGISGALRGDAVTVVKQINAAGKPVLAIDIPTGLDCDSGQAEGLAVRAALTVTFVARKKGFDAPDAATFTGHVTVADIGINRQQVLAAANRTGG
ncbi:MAG: NAD(P)H-hydrate epimerase [Planctomycetes bacterium]|jgi:NAD(P)H-hydrate epimerase|nr:NAD(P)H-hydrate epimerase [Planctomycetota bacterium]